MSLDDEYGELVDAAAPWGRKAVEDWERDHFPKSLSTLTDSTAAQLKTLMDNVARACRIDQFLVLDVIILWVVNQYGDIIFAVEEAVSDGLPLDVPRHRRAEHKIGKDKLGHPALVAGRQARVAGEIYYEIRQNIWVINMESGRYCLTCERKREHLENVRNRFAHYDIGLVIK